MKISNPLLMFTDNDNKSLSLVSARLCALLFSSLSLFFGVTTYSLYTQDYSHIIKLVISLITTVLAILLYFYLIKGRSSNIAFPTLFSILKGSSIMSLSWCLKYYIDILGGSYDIGTSGFITIGFTIISIPFLTSIFYLILGNVIRDFRLIILIEVIVSLLLSLVVIHIFYPSLSSLLFILNSGASFLSSLIVIFFSTIYFEMGRRSYQLIGPSSLTYKLSLGMVSADIYSIIDLFYALFHMRK